ncbi:MAG: TRAP transporter small permease subunit, partial [Betaproteobacteria bacterium]
HLLAALILLGICYALQRGDNVRVDVFYAGYSARRKYIVDLVSLALLLAVSLLFIKISVPYVMQSYVIGEGSADPGGIAYRWVIKAFIPLGYVLVALQCAAAIARRVLQERGRV